MRITEKQIRQIIREEILREANGDQEQAPEAIMSLTSSEKSTLQKALDAEPASLPAFATNLKSLSSVIDDLGKKEANITSAQLQQYWKQLIAVIKSMMSAEKTSSSVTSKVTKAV
jgi:hypothetical protein